MSDPVQLPAVPTAKRRLLRSLLAWGSGALGAWLLHAAIAAVHPAGQGPAVLGPDLGNATLPVMATACCTTPFVVGGLLLYVLLRQMDLRHPLWTGPLFACCFVANFLCPGGNGTGHALNSMFATLAAALLALGEALLRRSRRDAATALWLLVVALAEIVGLWALEMTSGC